METPQFQPLGDQAVLVRLGAQIGPPSLQAVRRLCLALERDAIPGVTEWVPAYVTVTVYYRPEVVSYDALCDTLTRRLAATGGVPPPPARTVEVPTRYGGEDGPDLDEVAARLGLAAAEVVALHSAPLYQVHMVGFAPGFPYLGGLPERLATPRLATPRLRVPAGSVAIGGAQTGIYPLEMPGGWRLLGRTALRLFDPDRMPPALLRPGDSVRFVPDLVP